MGTITVNAGPEYWHTARGADSQKAEPTATPADAAEERETTDDSGLA